MIDKKLKRKMIIILVSVLSSFFLSLIFSVIIYHKLIDTEATFMNFLPHKIVSSILNNQLHAMTFISVSMVFLLVILLIINNSGGNNYASELDEITDNIKTPKKVGQAQHGSARWLTEKEQDKIFTAYTIDKDNNSKISKLMLDGIEEQRAVRKYNLSNFEQSTVSKENK